MRARFTGALVVLALVLAALVSWQAPAQSSAVTGAVSETKIGLILQCAGVTSCTAAACHNAGSPRANPRSEYSIWFDQDRHARAFAVLGEKRSEIILRNLSAGRKVRPAQQETICLKCHALAPELAGTEQAHLNMDGVSCERCHGRAEKWLSIHYLPAWQQKSDEAKMQFGMTPIKNLLYRARQCAECHIGAPQNDLNHDLYAAGHPPLYYEFSAFLHNMPKHWSEREDKAHYPDLELRAWAVGQLTSAQAALDLLAGRAENKQNPWPEFAEYNCYACHHSLRADRPALGITHHGQRISGVLPWNSWFTALLPDAVDAFFSRHELKLLNQQLTVLRQEMEKPLPNREQVAGKASSIAHQLGEFLRNSEQLRYDEAMLRRLTERLADQSGYAAPADWEQATQVYLARAALYRAQRDFDPGYANPILQRNLENMKRKLRFPQGFNSPALFDRK